MGEVPATRTALEHRAVRLLGLPKPPVSVNTVGEVATFVARHLTYGNLGTLMQALKMSQGQFFRSLAISPRTFGRGNKSAEKTGQVVADRALRIARITALAVEVLEAPSSAREWLSEPQGGLSGRVPNDLLASEFGARDVEDMLRRIGAAVYV